MSESGEPGDKKASGAARLSIVSDASDWSLSAPEKEDSVPEPLTEDVDLLLEVIKKLLLGVEMQKRREALQKFEDVPEFDVDKEIRAQKKRGHSLDLFTKIALTVKRIDLVRETRSAINRAKVWAELVHILRWESLGNLPITEGL